MAEQESCFGEVDRPGVDGVEAVDKFAGVRGYPPTETPRSIAGLRLMKSATRGLRYRSDKVRLFRPRINAR